MAGRPKKIMYHCNLAQINLEWVNRQIEETKTRPSFKRPIVPDLLLPFVWRGHLSTQAEEVVVDSIDSMDVDSSNSSREGSGISFSEFEDPVRFWYSVDIYLLISVLHQCATRLSQEDRSFLGVVYEHTTEVQALLDYMWPASIRANWDEVTSSYQQPVLTNLAIARERSWRPVADLPFAAALDEAGKANMSARKNSESVPYTAKAIMAFFGPMHEVILRDDIDFATWREIIQYVTGVENGSLRRVSCDDQTTLELSQKIYQDILASIQRQLNST